ncbi:hypothetical protein, partial [Lacisediminimonas sp.]|uniref:hypothetical protein n=1 Tax=Lacisediminimonas sp. TaxID=3060582 RepID=UPI0027181EE8
MEAEAGRPANFCDSQPLMPGDIQTFGFLMVLNGGYQIVQVSENVEGIFGLSCESVLGRDFRGFLSAADSNRFMQTLTLADVEVPVMTLQLSFPESDTCFFASIRSIEGNDWLIEFEFLAPDDMDTQLRKRHRVAKAAMALKQCQTVSEMVEKAAADIKAVTCFDKVMIYQFEEGWHGTVVAEAAESDMDFYLGLRFP